MRVTDVACCVLIVTCIMPSVIIASTETIGPNGINAVGLGQTGINIDIGQVEIRRPGDPSFDTMTNLHHPAVNPAGVFFFNNGTFNAMPNVQSEIVEPAPLNEAHATFVAGVMIADNPTDPELQGLAPHAELFSVGVNNPVLNSTLIRGISMSPR